METREHLILKTVFLKKVDVFDRCFSLIIESLEQQILTF